MASLAPRVKWLLFAFVLLLLGAVLGLARYASFTRTEAEEGLRLQGQANIVSEHLRFKLQAIGRALLQIQTEAAEEPPVPSAAALSTPVLSRRLAAMASLLPGVATILVIDKSGQVRAASRPGLVDQNQGNRTYFSLPQAMPSPSMLFVTPPLAPSELGLYSLYVSRALFDRDGRFAGVAAATLSPADLATALSAVIYAGDMRVSVASGDGVLLVDEPAVAGTLGQSLDHPDALFTRHMQSGHAATIYSGNARIDGSPVMLAQQTLQPAELHLERPLVVLAGRSLAQVFADWRRQTQIYALAFLLLATASAIALQMHITSRKRSELAAQQRHRELTHLSRVAMLGELSGAIAHELNQPLTAILSNAQAALRFLAQNKASNEEMREILSDIVSEDRRAGEIIRRLRVLLSPAERLLQKVDLNEVVSEALALLHGELENQRVTMMAELKPGLAHVRADSVQLQQVLINLLLNACDAMRNTPVSARGVIVRTGLDDDGTVSVSVVDQGSGIADDILEKVFDSYFTTKPTGMGLGLSVCRSIVRAHDGRIWVENNHGRGVTFHFSLPAAPSENA